MKNKIETNREDSNCVTKTTDILIDRGQDTSCFVDMIDNTLDISQTILHTDDHTI